MRKLTIRDLMATLIVAAVVVLFIGYSVAGSRPFVHDHRGMAGTASRDACSPSPRWAATRSARARSNGSW